MRAAAVENIQGILPFLMACFWRRCDFGGLFDSNGSIHTRTGHIAGMMHAAGGKFGLYSSACMPGAPSSLFGGGSFGTASHKAVGYGVAGEPPEFTAIKCPATSAVDGSSVPFGNADWAGILAGNLNVGGWAINTALPVDLNGAVEFSMCIWRPAEGGVTSLQPTLFGSPNGTPQQFQLSTKTVACPTRSADGVDEVVGTWARGEIIDFNNALNAANSVANYYGEGFRFRHRPYTGTGAGVDGSNVFGNIGVRIGDAEKFTGVGYTPLYAFGGQCVRAVALDMCGITGSGGWTDAALAARLKALCIAQRNRNGQRLPPMLCIQILLGGNSANDATASLLSLTGEYRSAVSQTGVGSNTRRGYFNNTISIIRRIRYVWEKVLGYQPANLFFLLGCYHPQSQVVSGPQWTFVRTTMVDACRDIMGQEENATFVNGYLCATVAEFGVYQGSGTVLAATNIREHNSITVNGTVQTNCWYDTPTASNAHLNEAGYRAWGTRIFDALVDAAAEAGCFNPLRGGSSSEIQLTR